MTDERPPKPPSGAKPSLLDHLDLGRRRAGRLGRGDLPSLGLPTGLADAARDLAELEARAGDPLPFWQRTSAMMTLRGLERSLADEADSEATAPLVERARRLRGLLRARDAEELGPRRAALGRGEYTPGNLQADLAARPRYEWDPFVERLLEIDEVPVPEESRTLEMVHYVASPLDVILELLPEVRPDDVFYELGCGLGKVAMLVAWLTPTRVVGVELDPAYVRFARELPLARRLSNLTLVAADARTVDYTSGSFFYFYDPFRGQILADVLTKLEAVAETHPIRVATRGRSTEVIEKTPWLTPVRQFPSKLTLFASRF